MSSDRWHTASIWRNVLLAAAAITFPLALALVQTACSGNTTGVDNPGFTEIPIHFRDTEGSPTVVQGEIEIYATEQNPALYPDPVLRLPVQNRSFATLAVEDFGRIQGDSSGKGDSLLRFNLLFRGATQAGVTQTGVFASGFVYDKRRKSFKVENAGQPHLELSPQPLMPFSARMRRETVHGDLGRVYLPGTPFQATLVDSFFVFARMPEGRYVMRLLNADGKIFAVRESVDTRQSQPFTADPEPIGQVDVAYPYPTFAVEAGGGQTVLAGDTVALAAKLSGIDSTDARASTLWRWIKPLPDDSVWLESPTALQTRLRFRNPGTYALELAVSLGARTLRDTVVLTVQAIASNLTTFTSPRSGDTVFVGLETKVTFETGWKGLVRLEYAYEPIESNSWQVIADSIPLSIGGVFYWTPPQAGIQVAKGALRLLVSATDSVLAHSGGQYFAVRP
jgi:hypothetical protein